MKNIILAVIVSGCSLASDAQVTKVYCFRQLVSGGTRMDEGQKNNDGSEEGPSRYFIIAEAKKNRKIQLQHVWINGKPFTFKADTVKKLPFILETPNGGDLVPKDTLIKQSPHTVIFLTDIAPIAGSKVNRAILKVITTNTLVIQYQYQGKSFVIASRGLSSLSPLFTQ